MRELREKMKNARGMMLSNQLKNAKRAGDQGVSNDGYKNGQLIGPQNKLKSIDKNGFLTPFFANGLDRPGGKIEMQTFGQQKNIPRINVGGAKGDKHISSNLSVRSGRSKKSAKSHKVKNKGGYLDIGLDIESSSGEEESEGESSELFSQENEASDDEDQFQNEVDQIIQSVLQIDLGDKRQNEEIKKKLNRFKEENQMLTD